MRVWVVVHAVDDFYQGLVPATVPFFVLDRGYSYTAAAGLALAATLGSALPQPFLGLIVDRRRVLWLAPLGVTTAGVAAGLSGLAPSYWWTWSALLLSGLGIAAFHPPAGRDARRDAGDSATAMSMFASGGTIGFFLAPALLTPALVAHGPGATVWFVPPAVLMGFLLWRHQRRRENRPTAVRATRGRDRWKPFLVLTGVAVVRSSVFTGMNTFLGLYWIARLGGSPTMGGVALTAFLVGGVLGALAGGHIADRAGGVRVVQFSSLAAIPALLLVRAASNPAWALLLVVVAGAIVNMSFGVIVKLGQDYLPSRPGTAAGVTLGLSVSAGGLFLPVLGVIGDHFGPACVITVLALLPVAACTMSLLLPPSRHHRPRESEPIMIDRPVSNSVLTHLLEQVPEIPLPAVVHIATVELPPRDPGTPPHRHAGPVFGYMLEGEMVFELEGEPERVIRAGEAFWEPGGDVVHYQAANNLAAERSRFVVVMIGVPGEPMLTLVEPDELRRRADRRVARPRRSLPG